MRQYLVHAYGVHPGQVVPFPFNGVIHLQDHEVFDAAALLESQELLKQQSNCAEVKIVAFQLLETAAVAPAPAALDIQLNDCGTVLPPVDSPLVIEVAPGVLLQAMRHSHIQKRNAEMVFDLLHGGQYVGRPRWTHP